MPDEQTFQPPLIGDTVYIAGFVFNTQQAYLEEHRLMAISADEVTTEHLATYKEDVREDGTGIKHWPPSILEYLSIPINERLRQQAAQINQLCDKIITQVGRKRA